jgi:hypothetical protein
MTGLTSELRWNGLGPQPVQEQPAVLVRIEAVNAPVARDVAKART